MILLFLTARRVAAFLWWGFGSRTMWREEMDLMTWAFPLHGLQNGWKKKTLGKRTWRLCALLCFLYLCFPHVVSWEEERTASRLWMWLDSNVVDVVWPKIQFLSPGSVSVATLRINCLSSGCGAVGCSTITSPPFRLERNNTQREWSRKLSPFCLLKPVLYTWKKKPNFKQMFLLLERSAFLIIFPRCSLTPCTAVQFIHFDQPVYNLTS